MAILLASAVGGGRARVPSALAAESALDPLAVDIGSPSAVAVGPKGEIYVASPERGRVFQVGADGKLRIVAGEADRLLPSGLAVDPAGNVYVSDPQARHVYRIGASTRAVTIVAGSGSVQGDDGPAPAARLVRPTGLAWTRKAELLIADPGDHRVRRVDRDGRIHTVAGDGEPGDYGDGGPAVRARLSQPEAVASDARGNIYIADRGNRRIRRVASKTGTISPWPASGPATAAGLSVDDTGSLWIADPDNRRLLKLDRYGETVGAWSEPTAAPSAVSWDPGRGVLFGDATRHLVLRLTLGRAEVVAGNGATTSAGAPQPRR